MGTEGEGRKIHRITSSSGPLKARWRKRCDPHLRCGFRSVFQRMKGLGSNYSCCKEYPPTSGTTRLPQVEREMVLSLKKSAPKTISRRVLFSDGGEAENKAPPPSLPFSTWETTRQR